jgi:selenocysteine lyase/cysteine desulfurase
LSARHHRLRQRAKLGESGIFTWDGNYYAVNLTEQLDVERLGGFLRIRLVDYNTMEEVEQLLSALQDCAQMDY